jgi:CBS-domain-containing membrane protein
MTRNIVTVTSKDDVREAARQMADAQVRRLPVVDDGHLVGFLALGDMAKTHQFDMEASKALSGDLPQRAQAITFGFKKVSKIPF